MFRIYSDKDIFDSIISSPDDYPNWNKIIKDHSVICLDINQADLDTEIATPDTFIFLFLQANARNIDIIPLDNYFQTIYANLETVVENPSAAYFLNLPEVDAKNLQEDTGIIINCDKKIDDDILLKGVNLDWLADEVINNNWNHILNTFNDFPSNSLILNDRNLFTNDERVLGKYQNIGIDNLLRILDCLLPHNLKTEYHVLIQSEQKDDPKNKAKCDMIANILNTEIKKMRNYNFSFEIVFYYGGTDFFKHTHNRRIYSNYKYGKCENSLASFKIRDANNTRNDDSFSLVCFFNNISSVAATETNLKAHSNGSIRYKELTDDCIDKLNKNGPNNRYYRYYLNGVEVTQGQSTVINNRLLN